MFLPSCLASGRQSFIFESVKLTPITSDPPSLQTRTVCVCFAQVAETDLSNAFYVELIFLLITLNVSGGKICFEKTEQFWFSILPSRT